MKKMICSFVAVIMMIATLTAVDVDTNMANQIPPDPQSSMLRVAAQNPPEPQSSIGYEATAL